MHLLWFNYLSAILDPLAMDEAMEKAMLNYGLNVCDNDSMSMFGVVLLQVSLSFQ